MINCYHGACKEGSDYRERTTTLAFPKKAPRERTTAKVTSKSHGRCGGASRKQTRSNIRSSTVAAPSPAPKTKREQKAKRDEIREEKREVDAAAKASRVKGANSHHNPPKRTSTKPEQVLPFITAEEIELRDRCQAAVDQARTPSESEIADRALFSYESALIGSVVEVTDGFGMVRELAQLSFEDIFFEGDSSSFSFAIQKSAILRATAELVMEMNPDTKSVLGIPYRYDETRSSTKKGCDVIVSSLLTQSKIRSIRDKVSEQVDVRRWVAFVAQNKRYPFAVPYADAIDAVQSFDLRSYAPPETKRQFILDIGPTNSGKTHSGMQELMRAESGVYLGPLRLLAMEAADTMNEMGCPCNMLTGEERSDVDGARHVASTVEMLDRGTHYEVAVIDECQMITDPERGYAWAAAITSVNADVVHLCLAPEAEQLVCSILDGLDEDYEIEYHTRLVPLEIQAKTVKYPSGIKPGDALIVFSRKSVQRYVAELADHGISASMVYGALPYEVRKEEVRKFADGETDVVVATDAIGMGLNLPVQRVVFAELEKYDGHITRDLLESEIKQIAGRAGRYGKYDIGYVNVLRGQDKGLVEFGLQSDIFPVEEIRVDMPAALLDVDSIPLSHIMRAWSMEEINAPYVKRNLSQQIALARRVDDLPNDFVASAVEIPFKSGDRFVPLDSVWEKSVRAAYNGKRFSATLYPITPTDSLQYLEDAAKLADLAYGLAKRYGTHADMEDIDEHRRLISQYMIDNLRGTPGGIRTCHWCGKPLPDNSKHPMHDGCYQEWREEKYSWRNNYYDDNEYGYDDYAYAV